MLQNTHFGAGSDALQQVHGAGVKSNRNPDESANRSIIYGKKNGNVI